MKVKVKKTLFFSKSELQTILAALDINDDAAFPQALPKDGENFKQACGNLASAIRKEIR